VVAALAASAACFSASSREAPWTMNTTRSSGLGWTGPPGWITSCTSNEIYKGGTRQQNIR
jgi:hypothetical protein